VVPIELISASARLLVGLVLVFAGLAKLAAADEFARTLRQLRLPGLAGGSHTQRRAVGRALAASEVALGTCFALGLGIQAMGALVIALLATFSAVLAVDLVRGRRTSCNCFGNARLRFSQSQALARNALLGLLALVGLLATGPSLDGLSEGGAAPGQLGAVLIVLTGATMLVTAATLDRRRLRPAPAGQVPAAELTPDRTALGVVRFFAAKRNSRAPTASRGRRGVAGSDKLTEKLAERYRAAADAQRDATALTMELDRRKLAAPLRPIRRSRKRIGKSSWEALEKELLDLDRSLGEQLQKLYKEAAAAEPPAADRWLVRAALLHWTVLLRRRAMEGFHTAVAGLDDDPDCKGDLIADELLMRYFDALFRDTAALRREIKAERATTQYQAVLTLTEIARQTACLGAQQSALLASHLYWSFVELAGFLRLNGQERVLPYIVQAIAQPLLLFYDVEKYRGPYSPLARWFAEWQSTLAASLDTRRQPAAWHGLWLYDRRSGHLVGYRITDAPRDENDVDGLAFFGSIVRRENLGNYDCGFSEMVERGPGAGGYFCAGAPCGDRGRETTQQTGAFEGQGGISGWLQGVFRLGDAASAVGRFQEAAGSLRSTVCGESGQGADGRGGRGGSCDGGLEAAGRTRESEVVRCLSERVGSPVNQMMSCMGEQTGRCADPVGMLAKDLAQTSYAGVKLGRDCGLKEEAEDGDGNGGGGPGGDGSGKDKTEAEKKLDDAIKKLEEKDKEYQEAKQQKDEAPNKVEDAQKKADDAEQKKNDDPSDKNWDDYIKAQKELEQAKEALEQANQRERQAWLDRQKALEEAEKAYQNKKLEGNRRCPPDTPDCGGNDCSAMSKGMKETMDCVAKALDPQSAELEQLGWGRGQEPVVDPNPEEPGRVSMDPCFEMMLSEEAAPASDLSKGCWVVDCGPQMQTVASTTTLCGCQQQDQMVPPGEALQGNCANVYCAEGRAVFRNGHCTCSDEPDLGGGTGAERESFKLPNPPSFSTVHAVQFGQDWPRSSSSVAPGYPEGYP
jgi:hypothetical protein